VCVCVCVCVWIAALVLVMGKQARYITSPSRQMDGSLTGSMWATLIALDRSRCYGRRSRVQCKQGQRN
jgi:hypothetical protein